MALFVVAKKKYYDLTIYAAVALQPIVFLVFFFFFLVQVFKRLELLFRRLYPSSLSGDLMGQAQSWVAMTLGWTVGW